MPDQKRQIPSWGILYASTDRKFDFTRGVRENRGCGGFVFVVSGGYRDAVEAKASRFLVQIVAPVDVQSLVASVGPEDMRQINCLAQNAYFEAATQGEIGMKATADVVFNRLGSGLYPGSICEIIDEGPRDRSGALVPFRCQFSWRCDGTDTAAVDPRRWAMAYEVAYKEYLYRDRNGKGDIHNYAGCRRGFLGREKNGMVRKTG